MRSNKFALTMIKRNSAKQKKKLFDNRRLESGQPLPKFSSDNGAWKDTTKIDKRPSSCRSEAVPQGRGVLIQFVIWEWSSSAEIGFSLLIMRLKCRGRASEHKIFSARASHQNVYVSHGRDSFDFSDEELSQPLFHSRARSRKIFSPPGKPCSCLSNGKETFFPSLHSVCRYHFSWQCCVIARCHRIFFTLRAWRVVVRQKAKA